MDTWFSHMVRFLDAYDLGWSYWAFGPTHAKANKLWFGGFDHASSTWTTPRLSSTTPRASTRLPRRRPSRPATDAPSTGARRRRPSETRIGAGTSSAEADAAAEGGRPRPMASTKRGQHCGDGDSARRGRPRGGRPGRSSATRRGALYFHTVLCHTTDFRTGCGDGARRGRGLLLSGGVVRYGDGHRVPRYSSTELAQAAEAQCDRPGSTRSVLGPRRRRDARGVPRAPLRRGGPVEEAQARGDDDAAPTCEFFTFRAAEKRCVWKQGCPDGLPARARDGRGRVRIGDPIPPARARAVERRRGARAVVARGGGAELALRGVGPARREGRGKDLLRARQELEGPRGGSFRRDLVAVPRRGARRREARCEWLRRRPCGRGRRSSLTARAWAGSALLALGARHASGPRACGGSSTTPTRSCGCPSTWTT